jgi:microcystin-dependent protein
MTEPFVGEIKAFGFPFAPRGYALCNGQLLAIQQNQALFSLLGVTYGGDGVRTFALPNLQSRTPVHVASDLPLGSATGSETVTLTTVTMPGHTHAAMGTSNTANKRIATGASFATDASPAADFYAPAGHSQAISPQSLLPVGGTAPHENMQPFLVMNYCIAPPSPVRAERLRAPGSGIDGVLLAGVAVRHGVAGMVAEAMRHAGLAVPERLARAARGSGIAALRQAGEALRLEALFAGATIPVLFLKGTTLARRAYGAIGLRDAADIDLVVAPDDVERAWRLMAEAGYVTLIPRRRLTTGARRAFVWAAKDSCHRHTAHGFVVELHWRLSDDLADPRLPHRHLWQSVEVTSGRSLATLGDEALFVYLCTHGAAHLWARLKWLADIGALVATSPDGGIRYWRAAQEAGAERAAASALLLAHHLLETPLPPGFVAPRSLRLQWLNALALRALTAGGGARDLAATPYRGWAELTAKLLIAPRVGNRLAIVRRILISGEDIGELALPGALGFLYPLLRLPLLVRRRVRRAARHGVAAR